MASTPPSAFRGQNEALAPAPLRDISQRYSLQLEDVEDGPPPPAPPATATPTTAAKSISSEEVHSLLYAHSHFVLFSILGTLTRLGLVSLTTYPSSPLPGLPWAQFAGCVVMGFLLESHVLFPSHQRAATPLYLGLATGYCGSVTSFSSFMSETFSYLSNTAPATAHSRGQGVLAGLAYAIATLALSLGGLQAGAHAAAFLPLPALPLRTIDAILVPVGIGAWVAALATSALITTRWRGTVLACAFSPLGAASRFWASRWMNPVFRSFPLGTFSVNVVGTAVLAGLTVGRYNHWPGGGACHVLVGLADGFCGCLTTVSTFAVEIKGLRVGHAYFYAAASVAAGLGLMVVILGSYVRVSLCLFAHLSGRGLALMKVIDMVSWRE